MVLVTIIVPTLDRPTLKACLDSLNAQSFRDYQIVVKGGPRDIMTKVREGLKETESKYVALGEDDAVYPVDWLKNLLSHFNGGVGYVGGPCLPNLGPKSTEMAKAIAFGASSFFGTTSMAWRSKVWEGVRNVDENNIANNAVWLRRPYQEIYEKEFEKIPPRANETYLITRMKEKGWLTLCASDGYCFHGLRPTLREFARQIFRCGMGRMNCFKARPLNMLKRVYLPIPAVFTLYLLTLPFWALAFSWGLYPLATYVVLDVFAWLIQRPRMVRLPLVYPTLHISYGLGMIAGLFENTKTWT